MIAYSAHKLVESFQTEKGPRQRIVMQLGTLTLPKSEWKKLACVLEAKLSGQSTLLPNEQIIEEINSIIDQIEITAKNLLSETP